MDGVPDSILKAVAKRLKYYIDVERREEAFDLSHSKNPMGEFRVGHGPGGTGTFHYNSLQDEHLQQYYQNPLVRRRLESLGVVHKGMFEESDRRRRKFNSLRPMRSLGISKRQLQSYDQQRDREHLLATTAQLLIEDQGSRINQDYTTFGSESERSISLSIEDEKKATDENALSSRENQEESVEIPTQCAEVPPSTDVDTPFAHAETPLAHAETPLLHAQTPSESSQNITNTYLTESIDACNILYPPQLVSPPLIVPGQSPDLSRLPFVTQHRRYNTVPLLTPSGANIRPCFSPLSAEMAYPPSIQQIVTPGVPFDSTIKGSNNEDRTQHVSSVGIGTVCKVDASTQTLVHAETQTNKSALLKLNQQKNRSGSACLKKSGHKAKAKKKGVSAISDDPSVHSQSRKISSHKSSSSKANHQSRKNSKNDNDTELLFPVHRKSKSDLPPSTVNSRVSSKDSLTSTSKNHSQSESSKFKCDLLLVSAENISKNCSASPPQSEKTSKNGSASPPQSEKSSNGSASPPQSRKSSKNGSVSPPQSRKSSKNSSVSPPLVPTPPSSKIDSPESTPPRYSHSGSPEFALASPPPINSNSEKTSSIIPKHDLTPFSLVHLQGGKISPSLEHDSSQIHSNSLQAPFTPEPREVSPIPKQDLTSSSPVHSQNWLASSSSEHDLELPSFKSGDTSSSVSEHDLALPSPVYSESRKLSNSEHELVSSPVHSQSGKAINTEHDLVSSSQIHTLRENIPSHNGKVSISTEHHLSSHTESSKVSPIHSQDGKASTNSEHDLSSHYPVHTESRKASTDSELHDLSFYYPVHTESRKASTNSEHDIAVSFSEAAHNLDTSLHEENESERELSKVLSESDELSTSSEDITTITDSSSIIGSQKERDALK